MYKLNFLQYKNMQNLHIKDSLSLNILSNNEDYEFAIKLNKKFKIVFEKEAIVNWYPPTYYKSAFIMFYRFAKGDSEAKIFRPKVIFIFARYIIGLILLLFSIVYSLWWLLFLLILGILFYIVWAIYKNNKYLDKKGGKLHLALLQLTSDFAVMSGSLVGLIYGL